MASSWMMGVLFGLLLFCQGEAAMNLLGGVVTHPLIQWDLNSIKKLISSDSEAWKTCLGNHKDQQQMKSKRADVFRCSQKLPRGGIVDDDVDMDEMCRKTDEYTKCVHDGLKSFKNLCGLTGEVAENLEEAEKMHKKMSMLLCKNNHKYYKAFEKKGKACVKSQKAELIKCSKDYSEDDMEYEKEDCIKAWDFVECVEDALEDCKEDASDAVVKIMSEGLMATDCKGDNPNGGWTVAPVAFLTLLISFIPLAFIF